MDSAMSLFEKGRLEEVVAEKMGYINFVSTPWERLEGQNNVQRRQVSYHLNRQISQFGSKVSCIQQKTMLDNMKLYILDEVLTLHDVPFGDHFQVLIVYFTSKFILCIYIRKFPNRWQLFFEGVIH